MSWRTGYNKKPLDLEEDRRQKLAKERLHRAQERQAKQVQLQKIEQARDETNKALQENLDINPEIFVDSEIIPSVDGTVDIENLSITMANFDEQNADNGADAIKNLGQIRVSWNKEDPVFFFQKLETELQIYEINKQFTKRQALIRCLPDEVAMEFKHLVNLQETAAGDKAYKDLKTALIKAYGPRPGDAFQKAMSRVMTGKPSSLLKLIVSDICQKSLANCCCATTVWGIFQLKVPMYLKSGLANEVFNAENMHGIMDKADNLFAANQTDSQINIVANNPTSNSTTIAVTESAQNVEISAIRGRGTFRGARARGRGGRGRGGQNRGQGSGPDPRGKRHESNPPWNSCGAHWVFADSAWKCQSPTTCPMKDKVKPKNQA